MEAMKDPEQREFFDAVRSEFVKVLTDKEMLPEHFRSWDVDSFLASSVGSTLADLAAFAALEVKRQKEGKDQIRIVA
jgi:hypothetical protein